MRRDDAVAARGAFALRKRAGRDNRGMAAGSDLIQSRPEGLYCPAGQFWIDPWQPVPLALITHAHGDHARWGMGRYVATRASLGVLRARLPPDAVIDPVDYRQELAFGDTRVSFHSAGHVLGSAQIRVTRGDETW